METYPLPLGQMSAHTYSLGYLPDPPDKRDYSYSASPRLSSLVKGIDYSSRMSPVKDQGNRRSCVAHAMCAVLEVKMLINDRKPNFSEEMLYQAIAEPGGGAYPRNACKVLLRLGVAREQFWPYDKTVKDPVSTRYIIDWTEHRRALGDARKWRIKKYVALQ